MMYKVYGVAKIFFFIFLDIRKKKQEVNNNGKSASPLQSDEFCEFESKNRR